MLLSISVLLHNKADVTRHFLKSLEAVLDQRPHVEVILRNNGSKDHTEDVVFECGLRNLIYINSINLGFPQGHNENLKIAKGKYFLVLNNDLMFRDNKAIEKLIGPLQDEKIGLVGINGACGSLRPDGSGFHGNGCEYIEGSCLCGRAEDFRQYGLFSPSLKMFFFEDSDLSLRFRQMGFQLATVNLPHEHQRSQSLNLVDPNYKKKIFQYNEGIFKKRWGTYLVNKTFTNRILIKIDSLGIGDVIAMTPVLEGIRRDHPNSLLELTTSCPDVFLGNPHISELYEIKRGYNKAYDRTIDIKPVYPSYELLAKQAEKICGTKIESYAPQIFMSKGELKEGKQIVESLRENENTTVVGVALQMERNEWEGRNYSFEHTKQFIKLLQEMGIKVIEFGKNVRSTKQADLDLVDQISLREFFAVVANLDIVVGIDSLILHAVQAFSVPSFILFGATEPIARVVDFTTIFPIRSDLSCVGCYQRKGACVPDQNKCEMGHNQICMENITPEQIIKQLVKDRAMLLQENIKYLQEWCWREEL